MTKDNKEPNVLYYYGSRLTSVYHTRIRLGCSKLKYDLCFRLHVVDSPACRCGAPFEDAKHYFFDCPLYNDIRHELINEIAPIADFNLQNILYGNSELHLDDNIAIFDAVHLFITNSMRFVD